MGLKQQIFPAELQILELVFCMLLALIFGFAIGFERKMRFKEAGIRTHTIVCLGSCIYMLISIYAFPLVGEKADAARVAAQIVPGIGFIGAGIIFYRKKVVHGLTTAAGIWVTAAVGMATGAGWYVLSLIATVFIILIQCIMHTRLKFFHSHHFVQVNVVFKDNDGTESEKIREFFGVERFKEISVKKDGENVIYSVIISTDKEVTAEQIHTALKESESIISINRQDDDF